MLKTPQLRSAFGCWDVEKVQRRCGAKRISKSKWAKRFRFGALLEVSSDVEKAHAVVAQRTFRSENAKTPHARTTFRCSSVVFAGRPKDFCTLPKVSKTWGICRGGTFEEDLHRCISRRSGRWFPEKGCSLEHQIVILASMILRDRCKFLWPGLTFSCHAQYFRDMGWKNNRRKFRSQTSDNMDRWKAEQGRGREKRKSTRKKSRRGRVRRKKMEMREKVGKSRNNVFFQWFGAPEGRKVGSLKRRVRSQLARWEMKSCTALWREAHLEVKMYKTHHSRTTFGSWDVEKVNAVVARSTFGSQNVQNTPASDHFWKLRCWKSERRCGAKHISMSKCTKHTRFGPLLEVEMSKKRTQLCREAHFQVKMYKTHHARTTFGGCDVEKVHAVVARSTFGSQKCKKLGVLSLFSL